MKIEAAYPPMFDEIDAAFHVRGRPILYAWGDTIYNPMRAPVAEFLQTHEQVHGTRQLSQWPSIDAWWRRYIDDPQFRFDEELPAYIAQYNEMASSLNRHQRRAALDVVAKQLASPLYGNLTTVARAKQAILRG